MTKSNRNELLFDFDRPVERRGTHSLKWDIYQGRDVIPLWVADMDFPVAPPIANALRAQVDHGVFGYTLVPPALTEVVIERMARRYAWKIEPEWILWLPSLVVGLNVACRAVGSAGDAVVTMVPVYPPFLTAPQNASKEGITVPLEKKEGAWVIDFDRLEHAITSRTRLLLLCNPHNPTGRIFGKEELSTLADICERHDLVICSDEIHCELLLDRDKRHIPTATLDPRTAMRTITLMAPSKTFNLPGLGCSFAIIPDTALRRNFRREMNGIVPHVNALGLTAALAAYRDCSAWHSALLSYLRTNRDLVERAIDTIPGLSTSHVEATYLAWIDTRESGIATPAATFENGGVGLFDGTPFGGEGFVRLNFGCRRTLLEEALQRIQTCAAHSTS